MYQLDSGLIIFWVISPFYRKTLTFKWNQFWFLQLGQNLIPHSIYHFHYRMRNHISPTKLPAIAPLFSIHPTWKKIESNNLTIFSLTSLNLNNPEKSFSPAQHSDLDGPIVPKKLPLHQNGLQLDRKCLKFIVRYSPSPFFSSF